MTVEVFLRSLYLLAPSELNDSAGRLDSNGSRGPGWKVDASISEIYWLGLGLCCPDICAAAAFCNVFGGKIKEVFYSADTAQIGGHGGARTHSLMELKGVEWLKTEWRSCDVQWKGKITALGKMWQNWQVMMSAYHSRCSEVRGRIASIKTPFWLRGDVFFSLNTSHSSLKFQTKSRPLASGQVSTFFFARSVMNYSENT